MPTYLSTDPNAGAPATPTTTGPWSQYPGMTPQMFANNTAKQNPNLTPEQIFQMVGVYPTGTSGPGSFTRTGGTGIPTNIVPTTNPNGTPYPAQPGQTQIPPGGGPAPTDIGSFLQWMAQQPGHDPILDTPGGQDYYRNAITNSGGLNAGNLDYWKKKSTLAAYGGGVGAGGAGGGGSFTGGPGFLQAPKFSLPTLQDAQNMPGIQFAEQEGAKQIQNSAAAHGDLLTGGTLKDLSAYGAGTALFQGYIPLANLNLANNQANWNAQYQATMGNAGNLYNLANLGLSGVNIGGQ